MKVNKRAIDKAVAFAASVAAPILTFGVDQAWWSALAATDVGAIVAAAVGAYHSGATVQKRRTDVPPVAGP